MTFELNATAQSEQLRNARLNPLSSADVSPGFFTGSLASPLQGVARFGAKAALLAGEGMTPILKPVARDIDQMFGTDMQGFLDDERRKNIEALKAVSPDPESTGMAGQMISAVFDLVPSALTVGPVGTGILEGVAQKKLAEDRGVDPLTATKHGLVQGLATGIGVGLPMSLGLKAAPDLLYAAAANIVPNAAARGLSHKILDDAGYKEMAGQYQALDAEAILADGVLGVFFAGAGRVLQGIEVKAQTRARDRVKPTDVEAALSAQASKHLEIDVAPGIPRDAVTRDVHVQAAMKATDDLIAGRPVEVGARVTEEADFQQNPVLAVHADNMDSALRTHLGDAYDTVLAKPEGPVNEPLVIINADELGQVIIERGPAWTEGFEVKTGGFGLAKFIFKHGEGSKKSPEVQITREDVVRLPEVLNGYKPISDSDAGGKRTMEWQVERQDGKRVIYAVANFSDADGANHVVSIFVNEAKSKRFKDKPLSEKTNRLNPESLGGAAKARSEDTGPGSFSSQPDGQAGGSGATVARSGGQGKAEPPEVTQARQAVADTPELIVMDEAGNPVRADELMARADEMTATAENDAKAFEAAVNCMLRNPG